MNNVLAVFLEKMSQHFLAFLVIEARMATTFSVIFFMRREWMPGKLMLAFSVVLSLFVFTSVQDTPVFQSDSFADLVSPLFGQIILGAITALIINFFAEFFVGFGQIVSMQAGLGFVSFFVPRVGNITPLTQMLMFLSITIFMGLNGHLVVIGMMVKSIQLLPSLPDVLDLDALDKILQFSSILFEGAVMLSLAVIFSVMLSNITLAVLTKFSPQLNIFSIGINVSLVICFFMVYITFDLTLQNGEILYNDLLRFVEQLK